MYYSIVMDFIGGSSSGLGVLSGLFGGGNGNNTSLGGMLGSGVLSLLMPFIMAYIGIELLFKLLDKI